MFDFRYHALSLVAVFLALGIGIVLGASLGDTVVSEANRDVSASLRKDVIDARANARTAQQAVANRDDFIKAAFDQLAGGSLRRRSVAIVADGDLPQDVESSIRTAVTDAGGRIDSVSQFDAQPKVADLADKLGGRYSTLTTEPARLGRPVRRLGRALVNGAQPAKKLKDGFPDSFSGDFKGADAVVYYRSDDDRDDRAERFETALIEGLRGSGAQVVGVERSEEDPSQIPFYVKADLSSVDDVDQPAGRVALALALAGANGNFGFKDSADAPLPAPSGR